MRTLRLLKPEAWRAAPPPHPHPLHVWLTSRGSLTARIKAHVVDFNLVRLKQLLQSPNNDERRELGIRRGELAVVREVLLRDREHVLVFAHSLATRRDLRGAWRGLSRLGSRPLAEMLFNDPTVVRLPMEYRKMDTRHPLYRRARQVAPVAATGVWARRSVFLKQGRPLLVTEVFLTNMVPPA
jgi:chorismate--pyruvate lyase